MRSGVRGACARLEAAAIAVALLAGCGAQDASAPSRTGVPSSPVSTTDPVTAAPTTAGEEPHTVVIGDAPPPVVIIGGDRTLTLEAWTTCWMPTVDDGAESAGYCADGAPPENPELIESDESLTVMFPIDTWEFSASVTVATGLTVDAVESDITCGRTQTETLEPLGDGSWRLPLIGPAGDQTVTVFGGGPRGDVFVTFRRQTTIEGVLPTPDASVSVLADHDGELDSYGVELTVNDLSQTPTDAAATITVTSASGVSRHIDLDLEDLGCGSEGQLFFRAPADDGRLDTDSSDGPFRYDIVLTLDGVAHVAAAVWPDEQDEECAPCVPLAFDPPLPAIRTAG